MNNQVIFDISKIDKAGFKKRTAIVEAPELNEVMAIEEGQMVVFKIQSGTMDDILRSKSFVDQETASLAVRILAEASKKANEDEKFRMGEVTDELETLVGLSEKTQFELELVYRCVVEPKMTLGDIRWISENFPFVITRISSKIMEITIQGSEYEKKEI